MRGKPAAATPSFGERFRLPGQRLFHLFSPAFRRRKAAKAAPSCHAGNCLRLISSPFLLQSASCKEKATFHHPFSPAFRRRKAASSRSILSRGRLPAARVRRRATMRVCKQTVPDASRIQACNCRFALVTQPEAFLYGLNKRPNAPKNLPTLPAPGPAAAASPS